MCESCRIVDAQRDLDAKLVAVRAAGAEEERRRWVQIVASLRGSRATATNRPPNSMYRFRQEGELNAFNMVLRLLEGRD